MIKSYNKNRVTSLCKKFLLFFFIIILSLIVFKEQILFQIGKFTLLSEKPVKSDVIVILRGRVIERTLQAAKLFENGYGDRILIPTSLADTSNKALEKYDIKIPTEQEIILSILEQFNIPKEKIIISRLNPGGGTVGEAYRVKKDIRNLNIKRILIVTSWYHSMRVDNIYNKVLDNIDVQFQVIASKYGNTNSKNWWHYRYESRNVLVEFNKTLLSHFFPTYNLHFQDDPSRL